MQTVEFKTWDSTEGVYHTFRGTILHWGIAYDECDKGFAQYTVVFVRLADGTVMQVNPTNLTFIDTNKE